MLNLQFTYLGQEIIFLNNAKNKKPQLLSHLLALSRVGVMVESDSRFTLS